MKKFMVILTILFVLCFSMLSYAGTDFKDVSSTHWALPYINSLKSSMIINGYPDGTFKPQANVKINEFITMTIKALGYTFESDTTDWAKPYIDKAIELGIIKQDEFPSYTANINREQMASISVGAILLSENLPSTDLSKYVQEETTDFYKASDDYCYKVIYSYRLGVITGFTDHSFKPQDYSTRAQASTVISKIINKNLRTPFVRTTEPYTVVSTLIVDEFGNDRTMPIALYAPKFNGKSVAEIINVIDIFKRTYPTGYTSYAFNSDTNSFNATEFLNHEAYSEVVNQPNIWDKINALTKKKDIHFTIRLSELNEKYSPYYLQFPRTSENVSKYPKYSTYIITTYGEQLQDLFKYLFENEFDTAWNLLIKALDNQNTATQEKYTINGRTLTLVSGYDACSFGFSIKK